MKLLRILPSLALILLIVSCEEKKSSSNGKEPPVFALTEGGSINIANQTAFAFGGTCTIEGAEITVTLGNFTPWSTTCSDFLWEVAVDGDIVTQILEETSTPLAIEEAGNTVSIAIDIEKDATAPIAEITSPAVISTVNQGEYSLGGSCSEEGTLTVVLGDLPAQETPCQNGQDWSVEFDARSLSEEEQVDIVVNMVDQAGNPSLEVTAQVIRDVVGPEISITTTAADGVINTANENAYGLSGACEGTDDVSVTIGSLAAEEVSCASGAWEITGKDVAAVSEGSVVILVHQLDEHANPSEQTLTVTKDITPPALGGSRLLL